MSGSLAENPAATNGAAQQRAPRKQRTKAQIAASQRKAKATIAAKKAAAAQAAATPGTAGTIQPTPARAAGMKRRGRPAGQTNVTAPSGPRVIAPNQSTVSSLLGAVPTGAKLTVETATAWLTMAANGFVIDGLKGSFTITAKAA